MRLRNVCGLAFVQTPWVLQATRTQLSAQCGGCTGLTMLPLLFAPLAAQTCLKRLIPIIKTDLSHCLRQVNTLVWQRAVVFVAEIELGLLSTSAAPAAHSQHGWVSVNGCVGCCWGARTVALVGAGLCVPVEMQVCKSLACCFPAVLELLSGKETG